MIGTIARMDITPRKTIIVNPEMEVDGTYFFLFKWGDLAGEAAERFGWYIYFSSLLEENGFF